MALADRLLLPGPAPSSVRRRAPSSARKPASPTRTPGSCCGAWLARACAPPTAWVGVWAAVGLGGGSEPTGTPWDWRSVIPSSACSPPWHVQEPWHCCRLQPTWPQSRPRSPDFLLPRGEVPSKPEHPSHGSQASAGPGRQTGPSGALPPSPGEGRWGLQGRGQTAGLCCSLETLGAGGSLRPGPGGPGASGAGCRCSGRAVLLLAERVDDAVREQPGARGRQSLGARGRGLCRCWVWTQRPAGHGRAQRSSGRCTHGGPHPFQPTSQPPALSLAIVAVLARTREAMPCSGLWGWRPAGLAWESAATAVTGLCRARTPGGSPGRGLTAGATGRGGELSHPRDRVRPWLVPEGDIGEHYRSASGMASPTVLALGAKAMGLGSVGQEGLAAPAQLGHMLATKPHGTQVLGCY